MTGLITLSEAVDGCFEFVIIVEDSSRVLSSAGVEIVENESNRCIDSIVDEGSGMSVDVWSEVENASVNDEEVCEVGELSPIVTDFFRCIREVKLGSEIACRRLFEGAGRSVSLSRRGTEADGGVRSSDTFTGRERVTASIEEWSRVGSSKRVGGNAEGSRSWVGNLKVPSFDTDHTCERYGTLGIS